MTTLAELPTPSLLVDLVRLRRNCERMIAFSSQRAVRLRPHVKTHKCVETHAGDLAGITQIRPGNYAFDRVTQEHGEVDLPADADLDAWSVGNHIRILANHSCLTAAQHDELHVVEGGDVVATWRPARG